MNRLYALESIPTGTGALADHRLAAHPDDILRFLLALAAEVGVGGAVAPSLSEPLSRWLGPVAFDLLGSRGHAVVLPGPHLPAEAQVLAAAINQELAAPGATVRYAEPVEAEPVDQLGSLGELATQMHDGRVSFLIILGGNPVYDAPADVRFAEALEQVPTRLHLSGYLDETSERCHWHVPQVHPLETWSDIRAFDGTTTIQQPLIEPLYQGRSAHELLELLMDRPGSPNLDIVRRHWEASLEDGAWRRSLHDGLVAGTASATVDARVEPDAVAAATAGLSAASATTGPTVLFQPDPTVHDGRFANNGWLQECPKPFSKLTWENAALMSPKTATDLGVAGGDIVSIGDAVEAPVWILPGQSTGTILVHLGYGRRRAGQVGSGTGFDAYPLRESTGLHQRSDLAVTRVPGRRILACTQDHHSMEGRHLVRHADLADYERDPGVIHAMGHAPGPEMSLYPGFSYEGYSWGLSVDLSRCTGCNACVMGCQAENNIPVVGREQVIAGREMHWLRIDRYYEGDLDHAEAHHQPVMCQHCEQAPCEPVCPVAATVHSSEGLNDMVYNRCVGTRYCSNNCPYKVRRFNFFRYQDFDTPSLEPLRNPDVTVRSRGVMEKCTYCVQRINQARIASRREGRTIADGEIQTACQQACPTEAIVFGDLNDSSSRVARLQAEHRAYGLLEDLNTRPRTRYLAKIRNPNPDLGEPA